MYSMYVQILFNLRSSVLLYEHQIRQVDGVDSESPQKDHLGLVQKSVGGLVHEALRKGPVSIGRGAEL